MPVSRSRPTTPPAAQPGKRSPHARRTTPPGRPSRELTATAHHEAGHAVVSLALGRAVRRVSIVPNPKDDTLGHCRGYPSRRLARVSFLPFEEARRVVEVRALVLFAGGLAEAEFLGRANRVGAQGDREDLADLLLIATGSAAEAAAYGNWLCERARNMVLAHWHQIQAVAGALLERKVLSGAEVRELYWNPIRPPAQPPPDDLPLPP